MDNNTVTSPTFLDGEVTPRGQGQEGNMTSLADIEQDGYNKYIISLRNDFSYYICHPGQSLTDEDYMTLWDDKSYFPDVKGALFAISRSWDRLSSVQRIRHHERMSEIYDKLDLDAMQASMEKALINQRLNAKKSNHAGHELGAREFTFTYSPKWFSDEEARDLMKKAISKLIKYYSEEIVQLRAVGEVGSNGLSHVHCFYKLRGGLKISDKNFKRAYKYWNPKRVTSRTGHEGGHHANVRVESDFQGYIDKDVDTAWLDLYYPEVDPTA